MADLNLFCDEDLSGTIQDEAADNVRVADLNLFCDEDLSGTIQDGDVDNLPVADLNLFGDEDLSGTIQDEEDVDHEVLNNDIKDPQTIDFICQEEAGFLYSPVAVHDFRNQEVQFDMTEASLLGEDYFDRLRSGGLITQLRDAGLQYISQASRHFGLQPLAVVHAVNYLDRCLSTSDINDLHEERAYWFVSCLMVASKYVEVNPPRASELCEEFGLELLGLLDMEVRLAKLLEWRLKCSSPFMYLHHYLEMLGLPMKPNMIEESTEIILYAIKDIQFLAFKPWEISLAVVISVCLDEGQHEAIPIEVFHDSDRAQVMRCIQRIKALQSFSQHYAPY